MRLTAIVTILLPLLVPDALAQSSTSTASASTPSASGVGSAILDIQEIYNALVEANLTAFLTFATSLPSSTEGQIVLNELVTGNKTLLVPSNSAFANSPQNTTNTTLVAQTVAYLILNNTYEPSGIRVLPDHTIARTLLRDNEFSLPGNLSAPLVLARNSSDATDFEIIQFAGNSTNNITTQGPPIAVGNVLVYTIDQVPSLPPTINELAPELYQAGLQDVNNPSNLLGLIQGAGLVGPIAESPAVTVFAPIPVAFNNGPDYGSNLTLVREDFSNHVINGSVVYSDGFASRNPLVSGGGEALKISSNVSGTYVSSGNSSARIVQTDIIISNGVLHLIDTVLDNTSTNPAAAASAFSSGIAAAETATEPTGPVTATTSPAAATATPSKGATMSVVSVQRNHALITVIAVVGVLVWL